MERCTVLLLSMLVCMTSGFLYDDMPDWDYFTFSQSWPPGTCVAGIFEKHTCDIPAKVHTWNVHGLWPSRDNDKGPFNCDPSQQFDVTKVVKIKNDLETYWPNLYNDTDHNGFWAHEWSKHGTCCMDLPATSGELNYFSQGLKMNAIYNISSILAQSGIVPSLTAQYSLNDFINGIKKVTGYDPVVECAYTKLSNGTGYHLIDQIDICLDKQFKPRSCNSDKHTPQRRLIQAKNQPLDTDQTGPLKFKAESRRSSVHEKQDRSVHYYHQSNCPTHYNFNYPPIH